MLDDGWFVCACRYGGDTDIVMLEMRTEDGTTEFTDIGYNKAMKKGKMGTRSGDKDKQARRLPSSELGPVDELRGFWVVYHPIHIRHLRQSSL